MVEITIYDTDGDEVSPHRNGGTNQRIPKLARSSLQLAIEPKNKRIIGCIDVKRSKNQRSEQYWVEYINTNATGSVSDLLIEYVSQIKGQIKEWGYLLDTEANRSSLFSHLNQHDLNRPGEEIEHKALRQLAERNQTAKVSVGTPADAIGLLEKYSHELSVAIKDSNKTGDPPGFDLIILIDSTSQGITPMGTTKQQWRDSKREIRRGMRHDKIKEISNAIQYLIKNHDMTKEDIMREVPELSTPSQTIQKADRNNSSSFIGQINNRIKNSLPIKITLLVIIALIILIIVYILLSQFISVELPSLTRGIL